MNFSLTDEEIAALIQELHDIVGNDCYPFSDRIRTLKGSAGLLRRGCFDVYRLEPPEANQLGDAACIVAVRLHPHRSEGRAHVTCFHDRYPEALAAEAGVEPLGE
jgi:hypothetical protein